ncbi:NADH:flavin oxidoreductase [Cetobacterium sp. 8H]|uniref:NADH:flavin oxidoreductase n=1 Tax=Cetobacterium sp. 8H TaxID=2759681 RepID=UPI00163BD1CB|nr:NADH:flavin oxidoreductase [Cetobacterium sp. 8H]MBC2850042.1 NADH:flavin oxidoreductase [Cetobacterium sp. 8H]
MRRLLLNIFTKLQIKNINIKNRIVLPPMVRFSMIEKDGFVTNTLLDWYESVALNGVGMIIVEACCVSSNGKLRDNQLGIWNDSFMPGLKEISTRCKKYGCATLVQIHHAGFLNNLNDVSEKEIDFILEDFIRAFHRAKLCGFDGIELHAAHGYLLSQLMSELKNQRTDKYGGSLEKRMFFIEKLLIETKDIFDDNFILSCRIGGNEPTLLNGIINAKYLESLGVDIIHVSHGIPDPNFKSQAKIPIPKDFKFDWVIYMGCEIKKHLKIPVIGVRKITNENQASYLVENNLLDFVAVGRAMIGKPLWIKQALISYKLRKKDIDV